MIAATFDTTSTAPLKNLIDEYGYRSAAAFPLRIGEKSVARSPFIQPTRLLRDRDELKLLLDLAANTSWDSKT